MASSDKIDQQKDNEEYNEEYELIEGRILLQEDLGWDMEKLAITSVELKTAEDEYVEQRRKTLEILEKTVYVEEVSPAKRALKWFMGTKESYLENILHNPDYRAHEVCQGTLRRYDMYKQQTQTGWDLKELYVALQEKFLEKLKSYQRELREKKEKLHTDCEQIRRIKYIKTTTKNMEEILSGLQEYLHNYLHLPEEQQNQLKKMLQSSTSIKNLELFICLDDGMTRKNLVDIMEELKKKNKREMHRLLDQQDILEDERVRLVERLHTVYTSADLLYTEFQRMRRQGYALKHDFTALKMAKTGEVLNPEITELLRTAEQHHQENAFLLQKDGEVHLQAIEDFKVSREIIEETNAKP